MLTLLTKVMREAVGAAGVTAPGGEFRGGGAERQARAKMCRRRGQTASSAMQRRMGARASTDSPTSHMRPTYPVGRRSQRRRADELAYCTATPL